MKIIIVDNKYLFEDSSGAEAIRAMGQMLLRHDIKPDEIEVIQGHDIVSKYVLENSRKLAKEVDLIVFVHESFGMNNPEKISIFKRDAVAEVCQNIRDLNPRTRIIGFGFALNEPLPDLVKRAQMDAFFNGDGTYEDVEELLKRGPVTNEEIKWRGKNIEFVGHGRVGVDGLEMENEISYRKSRKNEGD